jgi:hypothetical protein
MAWDFDGTNDYMETALGANYDVPKTLACWFNSDTTTTAKTLVSLSSGSTAENLSPSLSLRITTGAAVQAVTSSGAGTNGGGSSTTHGSGTWHHAVARFASATSRIAYLDGVAGTENTTSRATGGALDNLILGTGSGGTYNPDQPFNGRLAEVAVWDVALSVDEITALARGYRPSLIRPDKLLWYIPLVREIQDVRSGLTITNAATAVAVHPRRIA